jgi:hypothetical protein
MRLTWWLTREFTIPGDHRTWTTKGCVVADCAPITFLVASWSSLVNAPADIIRASRNTLRCGWCIEKISQYQRIRIRISVVCIECVQTWGSSHEGCDPGCISILLAAILGYVVGDICEHLLEKIWSILVARSSETRLWTGGYAAGQNWQPEKDRVYLDSMEWEERGECLEAGVVW